MWLKTSREHYQACWGQYHTCWWPSHAIWRHDIESTIHDTNTLRPRQSERHLADDLYKWICLHENVRISIKISLKLVPEGPIISIPALVQILVWRRTGDKPLSEPMMVRSLTHICITWPHGVSGLAQECNISTANILEILQSYTKLLICIVKYVTHSFSLP